MFEKLLEKLALELDRRDVPYMIIGGQAVLAYGEPRLTRDIDLTLGWDTDHLNDILGVVSALEWKVLPEKPLDFAQETMVLPCQDLQSGIRIDFIFSFSPYEQKAVGRAQKFKIGQTEVCFATVEDLIIHKLVAGRPRDWEDVKNVLLKNPSIDDAYVHHWLRDFEKALQKPLVAKLEELKPS